MRIFPSTYGIDSVKNVNMNTDIPLAYIDTNLIEYDIELLIDNMYSSKSFKEVVPYQRISRDKTILFDKNGQKIPYDEVQESIVRIDDEYVYIPKKSRSFNASTFNYSLLSKRHSLYSSSMPYNIRALTYGCRSYANNLISIFGDAYKRKVAPSNITVNNGDLSIESLLNTEIMKSDVVFARLKDASTIIEEYDSDILEGPFDKEFFFEQFGANIIGFLDKSAAIEKGTIVEDDKVKMHKIEEERTFTMEMPLTTNKIIIDTEYVFNIPKGKENVIYHDILNGGDFTPVLIEENVDKGYFVYLTEDIVNDAKKYSKIIYEIMMFILLNKYSKTEDFTEWISDVTPDFEVINMELSKKISFMSKHNIEGMTSLKENEVTVRKVIIDEEAYPFVDFIGISNNYLEFKKKEDSVHKDPMEKAEDELSIYSNGKIFLYKDLWYAIDDNLNECVKISNDNKAVKIYNSDFRHSSSGVFVKKGNEPVLINLITSTRSSNIEYISTTAYVLMCSEDEAFSSLSVTPKTNSIPSGFIRLGEVLVKQKENDSMIVDMRQRGGGLPRYEKDIYSCLDIGHLHGRPYRKGGAIIITLPKKLKKHKERIENIIKAYSVAEDYAIVLFEGDDDKC